MRPTIKINKRTDVGNISIPIRLFTTITVCIPTAKHILNFEKVEVMNNGGEKFFRLADTYNGIEKLIYQRAATTCKFAESLGAKMLDATNDLGKVTKQHSILLKFQFSDFETVKEFEESFMQVCNIN